MPNIKSAEKRVKVNAKKYSENRSAKSELMTAIKKFKTVALAADLATAEKLFPATVSIIDSAAAKGIIHKNNASGKVSDISKLMRDLRAGKITAPVVEVRKSKKSAPAPVVAAETEPVPATPEKKATKKPAAAKEKPAAAKEKPAADETKKPAAAKEKPVAAKKKAEPKTEEKENA